MFKKISKEFICDLLSRSNIIDVISSKIVLVNCGKYFRALCPFHEEKNPSFTVSFEKQFYYCFGCGVHGNVIDFLMNYDHLGFIDVIQKLSLEHNIRIPYKKKYKNTFIKVRFDSFYFMMKKIAYFYHKILNSFKYIEATKYLIFRGLNKNVVKKFLIGFAPKDWNILKKNFGDSDENLFILRKTGLIIKNKFSQFYDRFRSRIIFPIRNRNGYIIAFGGRTILPISPKYINSPESFYFSRNQQIYGLYEILLKNNKLSKLLVVEGYFDLISLNQFGINYVVSSFGINTSLEQVKILYRYTNELVFCYDGDNAGKNAAWRILKIIFPILSDTKNLKFIFLPFGEDPDSLIRKKGKKYFEKYINKSVHFSKFFFDTLISKVDFKDLCGFAKLSSMAIPLINMIKGNTTRLYLRNILGKKIGILDENQLEKIIKKKFFEVHNNYFLSFKSTKMRILISLLLQNPYLSRFIFIKNKYFNIIKIPGISLFLNLVKICNRNPKINTAQLLEFYRNTNVYYYLKKLAIWDNMITNNVFKKVFLDIFKDCLNTSLKERQDFLIARDRLYKLNDKEKQELWFINKKLSRSI